MFQLIGADAMVAALRDRPHVRAIVSGHLHEVFDRREGDLQICGGPSTWYAIEHTGDDYRLFTDGLVGAQVLTLGDDGSFACNRVESFVRVLTWQSQRSAGSRPSTESWSAAPTATRSLPRRC